MNLLIVDDEALEAAVIEKMIDKRKYGLEEIYKAYSMKQAIEIMESHQVSILISDIEMPKGSGHNLAEWVKDNNLNIVVLFLTSHALFHYAAKAMQLNVKSYILKPVTKEELEKNLQMAAEQVKADWQREQNKKYASYWNSSKFLMKQEFWRKFIFEETSQTQTIKVMADKYGISYHKNTKVYPVLVTWRIKNGMGENWDDTTLEFAIRNVISENLWGYTQSGNLISRENRLLVIYEIEDETDALMKSKCGLMLKTCLTYFDSYHINCYIMKSIILADLPAAASRLLNAAQEDVGKRNRIYDLEESRAQDWVYEKPDMESWMSGIFTENYQKCLPRIKGYLDKMTGEHQGKARDLHRLQQDFLQELYVILEKKGIQANSIFKEEEMVKLYNEATSSAADMYHWIKKLIKLLNHFNHQVEQTPTIVETVKMYIEENLDSELSRNDLATKVYLHPDYLSHVFKEKTGVSISDYIIDMRMKKAKNLLLSTNERISMISFHVGYSNTAYFTKVFKRTIGLTPKEYRKAGDL